MTISSLSQWVIQLSSIQSYIFVLLCHWLSGGLRWRLLFAFIALPEEPSLQTAAWVNLFGYSLYFQGGFMAVPGSIAAKQLRPASICHLICTLKSLDKAWSWLVKTSLTWLSHTEIFPELHCWESFWMHGLKIPFCCVGMIDPLSWPWGEFFVAEALISWLESPSKGEF